MADEKQEMVISVIGKRDGSRERVIKIDGKEVSREVEFPATEDRCNLEGKCKNFKAMEV
jgi:hypothetical protein